MKVYMISANWGHGGPGGIASDLYYVLKKNGHQCRFAYARETVPDDIDSYRIGTKKDVYLHVLIARVFDNAGFLSTAATKKMIEDIKQYAPDVISIQNPLGYSMNVEVLLQELDELNIPIIWTLHDCWAFTGHCTTELCEKVNKGCGNCPHKKDFPKSFFMDHSAENIRRKSESFSKINNLSFIAPCKWISELARESYLRKYPIRVIHNGIDLRVFKPTESTIRQKYQLDNKIIILAVASVWSERKGSKYIYKMAKQVESSYMFVMIGKSEDDELKTTRNIIHIERTENRNELAQWYTAADVFINPTMGDNFPTVNLEALACGTPVITFNTGGSGEAVGECGAVVDQEDVQGMLKEIYRITKHPISSDTCVERARLFDKNLRYQDYVKLYESEIGRVVNMTNREQ